MLAVNRIAKVPGRMILLIDSTITRNGRRILGAPCGTKWANICVVFFNQPCNIRANQRGRLKAKVNTICLEQVKI